MDAAAAETDGGGRTVTEPSSGQRPTERDDGVVSPPGAPAAEDVEEFLAIVAHELRTPMAVTASAADTLTRLLEQDEIDRAAIERIADVIQRHSRLSARLVARLALAHEIGRGTVELELEELDLSHLVEELVSDVASFVLPERTVTVTASDPVIAPVDRASISEVVFNLLANAQKYSGADAAIDVRVDQKEGVARIVVRDQGSGVSPGDTEAIFEAYVQAGPRRGGVGLGLHVSRELARAHGGDLSVRPAEEVGSEFILELPIDPE